MAGRRMGVVERMLPLSYLGVAALMFVLVLPSVLRPPPDQATASAEFSPDAPPDENQDSIVAALNRGTTGTAGSGEGVSDLGETVEGTGVGPGVEGPPSACPRGFGDPPRQDFSLYAPPCAKAFQGDNGGSTYKGVDATEIRIAVHGNPGSRPSEGPVSPAPPGQGEINRTLRVMEAYFNQNYQLYGRQLRIFAVDPGGSATAGTNDSAHRAAVERADKNYKVFGGIAVETVGSQSACDEYARRGLMAFCAQFPSDYFQAKSPHLWSFWMDGTKMAEITAEYLCKKLIGKMAAHGGSDVNGKPRRIGIVYYDNPNTAKPAQTLKAELEDQCGYTDAVEASYNVDNASGQQSLGQIALRFITEGVTTVVPFNEFVTNRILTSSFDQQGYFPEWVTNGFGALDVGQLARLQSQTQWEHAFGFSAMEMARPRDEHDCYRAYKSIEPNTNPHYATCFYIFHSLQQLVAGIQMAGPNLTPEAFKQGLFKVGHRFYDTPGWATGGGFGPGDLTYMDNVTEIWWDPTVTDPAGNGSTDRGAYYYVRGGQRYRQGEIPREDSLVFKDGSLTRDDF